MVRHGAGASDLLLTAFSRTPSVNAICYLLEPKCISSSWILWQKSLMCNAHRFSHGFHSFFHSFHRFLHGVHWLFRRIDRFFCAFHWSLNGVLWFCEVFIDCSMVGVHRAFSNDNYFLSIGLYHRFIAGLPTTSGMIYEHIWIEQLSIRSLDRAPKYQFRWLRFMAKSRLVEQRNHSMDFCPVRPFLKGFKVILQWVCRGLSQYFAFQLAS